MWPVAEVRLVTEIPVYVVFVRSMFVYIYVYIIVFSPFYFFVMELDIDGENTKN